jgi:hypothetical protein
MTEENQQGEGEAQATEATEGQAVGQQQPESDAPAESQTEGVKAESVAENAPAEEVKTISDADARIVATSLANMAVSVAQETNEMAKQLHSALENCRLYASKKPKEEWARNILRFCADAGVTGSPLRGE